MTKLLCIDQLSWSVENKRILQNISFDVCKGEVIGIIGPNGAGKTSLLKSLTTQLPNTAMSLTTGAVFLKGKTISQYSAKQIAQQFALVMQKNDAIFSLSVLDIVKMGLLPHKALFSLDNENDYEQIEVALEKVGLKHAIHEKFNQLSGGEQQRALIARALVQSAEILILDEPTNHLDVYYQHQILQLVNQLNITVIMTVHDLNLASQYCQRLLLLNQGTLKADGSPQQVLTSDRLTDIFNLSCQQYIDSVTGAIQVSFYLSDHYQESNYHNRDNMNTSYA